MTALVGLLVERVPLRDLLYVGLRLAGWSAVTLLTTLGLFALAFYLLGNASLIGMMTQLQGFSVHYVSAAADARASFDGWLLKTFALLLLGVGFFRRSTLFSILATKEARRG